MIAALLARLTEGEPLNGAERLYLIELVRADQARRDAERAIETVKR